MPVSILGPRSDVASPEEVRAFREAHGWTAEELADAVHASPLEVSAWEAGAVRVPPEQAERVRWFAEMDEWNAKVDRVRVEPCDWVREHVPHLYEIMFIDVKGITWYSQSEEIRDHVAVCATCQAVWEQAKRTGGRPPEPVDAPDTWRTRYRRWTRRFPRWIGKPLDLLGELPELAIIALFVSTIPSAHSGLPARIHGLAMGLMLGWLALRLVGEANSHRPRVAGVLAGIAGGVTGLVTWSIFDAAVDLGDPRLWAGSAAVGVALGLIRAARARDEAGSVAPALPAPDAERPLLTSSDARPGARGEGGAVQASRDVVEAGRYAR